jgi:CIC family chloride channel protein
MNASLRDVARRIEAGVKSEHVTLGALAVVVGGLAGGGAIVFRYAIDAAQIAVFWEAGALADIARALPFWHVLLAPTLGGLVIGILCVHVLPGPQPQGVAQVIEANALRNGRLSARQGLGAAVVNALAIGAGGSVGREGPIVHVGATLASAVARRLGLGASLARTLLGCGVAAAVASAFNAPIAGVFFALEVVIGHYALTAFSPVVIASVIGTIVSRAHFGDAVAFILPPQSVASFFEFPAFVLLGLLAGGVAIAFLKTVSLVDAVHTRLAVPLWLRPALAGLAVGVIALGFPEVLGIGYATTDATLDGAFGLAMVVGLALAKALATALCLGSRFGGGVFSPSLVLGALVGVGFDQVAGALFPELSSSAALYGILGMGAVAGAVLGAPISTIIMVFELTHDYGVTFALMVTVAIATLFTMQVHGHSFFTWQLARAGLNLGRALELRLLERRRVAEIMHPEHHSVAASATLEDLKRRFRASHVPIYVRDDAGRLVGEVSFGDLADAAFAPARGKAPTAGDLAHPVGLVLYPDDDLGSAWRRAKNQAEDHIPVVRSPKDRTVLGEVMIRDLMLAYNDALLEARALERGDA